MKILRRIMWVLLCILLFPTSLLWLLVGLTSDLMDSFYGWVQYNQPIGMASTRQALKNFFPPFEE